MATLAESISLFSSTASFEPIDSQECQLVRNDSGVTRYLWPVDQSELTRLNKFSPPRENCRSCGKREEFIDHVYTAAMDGIHDATFMKKVFTGEIPPIGKGVVHMAVCSHCDSAVKNPVG
ncbi:hypothetical protein BGZ80_001174 [Entomortierella chlamydospora]|uniref:Uncharacterized protein n=1 Tax=Entomortierella chlamydospora TaxID=101097 RepID=A0A9P6MRK9_9FUNG|nr:hypothetical protein BGZ80_001174 [Entomortierella chlamydospora]